jgi:hypothetical protein
MRVPPARVWFAFDPSEGTGEGEIVFLIPAFEGVMVALSTFNANAEEELADAASQFFRGILDKVEGCRRFAVGGDPAR